MAPANPLPLDPPVEPLAAYADKQGTPPSLDSPEPVSPNELNSWRRGFTTQAEIWNGRLAMLGLSVGLTVLLVARLVATRHT